MTYSSDVLKELSVEEIIELRELYKKVEEAHYVYTLIDMALRWRRSGNTTLRVTSPNNSWRRDGSIVIFLDFKRLRIFGYSFDKTYTNVREGLIKTKRIKPNIPCVFANTHESYVDIIRDVIKQLERNILKSLECNLYAINIKKAAAFKVNHPPETYVDKLNNMHVNQINDLWYHKYENSDKDVRMFIEHNGGYGLFLKSSNELVSWVLQGHLGHINILQTEEKYRGKGYGKLMLQTMAQHIAQSGHTPAATVLVENEASNNLFRKTGFETKGKSLFIITQ